MTQLEQNPLFPIWKEWEEQVNIVFTQLQQLPETKAFSKGLQQLRKELESLAREMAHSPSFHLLNKGNQLVGAFFATTYHEQRIEEAKGYWQELILYFQEWEDYLYTLRQKERKTKHAAVQKLELQNREPYVSWSYAKEQVVPLGSHQLPALSFPVEALSPFMEKELLLAHHQYHQQVIQSLNHDETKLRVALQKADHSSIPPLIRKITEASTDHFLHTLFWEMLTTRGRGEPVGEFAEQLKEDWGGYSHFRAIFTTMAENLTGEGWVILAWAPRIHRLVIYPVEKGVTMALQDTIPLLALDLWEHAYTSQYGTERQHYIAQWWNWVDWHGVNERFKMARIVKWPTN